MKCSEVRKLLGAYIYGDLTAAEMRDLRLHVHSCQLCAEELRAQSKIVRLLDGEIPSLDYADHQRIAWLVKGAVEGKNAQQKWFSLRPSFALAATLLLGLAVGTFVGSRALRPAVNTVAAEHSPSNITPKKFTPTLSPRSRSEAANNPELDENPAPSPAENPLRWTLRSLGTIANRGTDPRRMEKPNPDEQEKQIWSSTPNKDPDKSDQVVQPETNATDRQTAD